MKEVLPFRVRVYQDILVYITSEYNHVLCLFSLSHESWRLNHDARHDSSMSVRPTPTLTYVITTLRGQYVPKIDQTSIRGIFTILPLIAAALRRPFCARLYGFEACRAAQYQGRSLLGGIEQSDTATAKVQDRAIQPDCSFDAG